MTLGLNEQELWSLFSFGDTAEEMALNIFGTHDKHMNNAEKDARIIGAILEKMAQSVIENNKRITEQLISAGINLSV